MSTEKNQLNHALSSTGKVLVAEDNLMNQKVIKVLLQKEGYEVNLVSNGKEALQQLEQQAFDCLILDYQMPELDGLETLQAIREHVNSYIRKIPVIFLTAEINQEKLRQLEQFGVFRMLPKPIVPKELIVSVAQLRSEQMPVDHSAKTLDTSYLHAITDGNAKLMVELIDIFMEEAPLAIANMKAFFETQDLSALLKTIHKIRSNYKYVGIQEGETLLAELEKDVETNQNPETYLERIQVIQSLTLTFMQALSREKQLLQNK